MSVIEIPFLFTFKDAMLSGKKTMTTRTKSWAKEGDTFLAFGRTFRVKSVVEMKLGIVAYEFFSEEGFDAAEDFIETWNTLHPRKLWNLEQKVFSHSFELVKT